MTRKRTNKDRKKAFDKARWSNNSKKERWKKSKKSASGGRTSSPPQIQSQNEDTVAVSSNQSELQHVEECTSIPLPATGKADAQTQTRCNVKHKYIQTVAISHRSRHTQTESDPRCEATIQGLGNTENDSPTTNEEEAADDSMATPPNPGEDKKKGTTTPSKSDAVMKEEDIKNKNAEQTGKDSLDASKSTETKPTSTETKPKSYAEATSSKDSKDKKNQTAAAQEGKTHDSAAQRKPSPVRGPTGKPMFTFYVYLVLDKHFKFNREKDKLLICTENSSNELHITLFRPLKKDGYLIEADFSVEEGYVQRGNVIRYKYAVQQQGKERQEIATRHIHMPYNHSEKEMHIFEVQVMYSSPGWLQRFFRTADKIISGTWHSSAYLLLNRLFEKWEPSNQEAMKTFTQLLYQYQWCFLSANERVSYHFELTTPFIKVPDLIAAKLVKILNGETEGKSENSVDVSPLAVGLSVFQVTHGCNVSLGIKDWGLLCQLVSSAPALRQVHEIQNSFPALQYTVIGLMNKCARLLLSEMVLLVPLLHSVRQLGADSGRLGPTVEEPDQTGLNYVEFRAYRERMRACSDKRRMILELVEKHKLLAKDKPHLLSAWLSMMAFDDISVFAKSTDILPEQLIQSLMFRLRDFQSYLRNADPKHTQQNLEVTEKILTYLLNCVDKDKERLMSSKWLESICQCCRHIHKSTCTLTRLVPSYKAPVLSFQLVLKMAEIQHEFLSKHGEEKDSEKVSLLKQLEASQKEFSQWKDNLLQNCLIQSSRLSYPKEIELWNAFFGLECSVPTFTEQWMCSVEKGLRKRISELSDIQQVQICCLETPAEAIEKSHTTVQTCFQDLWFSAIKRLCQAGKEGNLLQTLLPRLKHVSSSILSFIITESTACFGEDRVSQLLNDQSAVNILLSQGDWSQCKLNEEASQVMSTCQTTFGHLVSSLCQGNIPFGQLQIILKHRKQFQELYKKCKKLIKLNKITIEAERLLSQREKDYQALLEQRTHIDVLIKMVGKISEMIHVPENSQLEKEHKIDMQPVGLNELVGVQSCFSNEDLKDISTGPVLYLRAVLPTVLDAARQMHQFQDSNLILKSWMDRANALAHTVTGSRHLSLSLEEVLSKIWQPSLSDFFQLGTRIGYGYVTFEEVDKAVEECEDNGDGTRLKKEMDFMATKLETYPGLEKNWPDLRFSQIQEYRQLHHAAESASAILKIKSRLNLKGDFSHICSLTQLSEKSFKKKHLASLSSDLISAKQKLSHINHQHTACLEAFLKSEKLVDWVKATIENRSELKVFTDLASISAGENDLEIDRLRSFQDAVSGYSPLLYSLREEAGFEEFIARAQEVWDAVQKDEKLPEKLKNSTCLLDWLKGLSETHGSVEKSSLYFASAINTHGVYHVGWPANSSGKKSLGSVLCVKVKNSVMENTLSLDQLLDLQNKLMLMSSQGEHGKEQVNKFTEIFEGVQRMGCILMQLCSSGNLFFRDMFALVNCNQEMDPCINLNVPLLRKDIVYHGHVAEELQKVCRTMEDCHENWCSFMSELRSQFYELNYYTSEQVVYLCHWINKICEKGMPVPQQIWHLLSPLKPDSTLRDIRLAFAKAKESLQSEFQSHFSSDSEFEQSVDISRLGGHKENANIDEDTEVESVDIDTEDMLEESSSVISSEEYCERNRYQEDTEEEEYVTEEDQDELEDGSDDGSKKDMMNFYLSSTQTHKCKITNTVMETLENLWQDFMNNMPKYLTQYMDIKILAQFLSCFSALNKLNIMRKLPSILQDGKPNLILCPAAEIITTTLALYMKSPEQAFPSIDEVLMCQEDTSEEEVEIFLRRCLGQGAPSHHQKIYTLVNPGLLTYDVSVALAERFEAMERSAGSNFRMVIVCPVNQDRYIPSFFSNYKVQAGVNVSLESAKQYLQHHLTTPYVQGHQRKVFPDGISSWLITSRRAAVGKSLYVTRMFQNFKTTFPNATYLPVRLVEPNVDFDCLVQTLCDKQSSIKEQDPVLLHIDTAAVRCGLEEFLFRFLILGCLSDSEGKLWRRNSAHLIAVEAILPDSPQLGQSHKESNQGLLSLLPTIHCKPPKEVKELELTIRNREKHKSLDPLMDRQEFESEGVQRPYQYLRRFNRNQDLDHFKYQAGSVEGNKVDCLHHLLSNCGLKDPSWAELKHFTWFLNLQLKDCENSGFCDPDFFGSILSGFKSFIVKFMIHMARDFASPSMNISDQSPSLLSHSDHQDDLLSRLTIRKQWENESHPYIFFNADHLTMTFLGFHVNKNSIGNSVNVVDPQTKNVLMGNVMSSDLFTGLQNQGISFSEDFDKLPRNTKIKKLSIVVGAQRRESFDPDPTYELTSDNVMKMLAIHMRFRCEIPVIIMGETGCGKTRLVKFLCDLQREGRHVENMKLVKVHGGTTADTIYKKVREAEELAQRNSKNYKLDTILFFDEANTTEAIFAIKEVLCDKTVQGEPLKKNSGLKIIAACNPYRRHTARMIERLERAGLGYRVKAGETKDRLGQVPMRQLVYRVHQLPPSMIPLVWDFGQLSDSAEHSYIRQIVQKQIEEHGLPFQCQDDITQALAASQRHMRHQVDECSFVSLRDVERSMRVLVWFYKHRQHLFPKCIETDITQMTFKCLALALGICYYPSLELRDKYLQNISRFFPPPLNSERALQLEISSCQDFFLQNIQTRETIAKNLALKENVFLMVVCIELKIPLFLVGKPGSSKSLAKTIVTYAMQGQASQSELFQKFKEVHMVSFQCSPHSSSEGIIGTFRSCARFQKDKNLDEYVSVVVLDEIGLAEDSSQMPLKTLHPLLEDGCIDSDRPDPHMKVGFVGISNWALDPAKMNRGIFVSRWDPSENELVETAKGICSSSELVRHKISHLLPKLAKGFLSICKSDIDQFFGLRDYYSLVKMIFALVKNTNREPNDSNLAKAILRNFSGQKNNFDPLCQFQDLFSKPHEIPMISTLEMIKQNLDHNNEEECRYLLLLTTNNAALHIIQQCIFSKDGYTCPEIVFGSGFPKDQEYAQICRNVSRVKMCMETGRTVILLNLLNLYESLYDALNQYYVYFSGQQYVDLGLGSHRVKCRVHKDFRMVVIEDQEKVYDKFPIPLKNRLEKHRVDRSTDLTQWQQRVLEKLKNWVNEFSQYPEASASDFSSSDAFVGFHGDACASALLQALEQIEKQNHQTVGDQVDANMPRKRRSTEDDINEHKEHIYYQEEEVKSYDTAPNDDKESALTGIDTGKTLLDENNEGLVLMDVDDSEGNTEAEQEQDALGKIPVSVDMDIHPDGQEEIRLNEPKESKDEEEEVYEYAKHFLLNCSTPDSVLRLKKSGLGNNEVERLQRLYFHQQDHHSLRAFMHSHLKKSDKEKKRFIEVTTFSSLLTKADLQNLAQALGLSVERLLLLSLHQFDTEASFCSKIRQFLKTAQLSLHVLLVQMDMEESLCKNELISSAKYCTMNELLASQSEDPNCYIVFITKLSRIASGNKYIGFQGGAWISTHIDDLRDTKDMSLDLSVFCGTPISKLLSEPVQSDTMEVEDQEETTVKSQSDESAYLHSLSLVKSCTQKAVSLLRDSINKASRSMERMDSLLGLLENDLGCHGARFQEVLLKRMVVALTQKEECMLNSGDWVNREIMKREALQEGGTLRHTLWRCLQGVLTPILACILEVLDRDCNLDLLYGEGLSEGLVQFWLDIFDDGQILELPVPQNSSSSEEEIDVQYNLVVGGEAHTCTAPFSWLIKLYCHNLWEEAQFVQGIEQSSHKRIQQFVSAVTASRLGGYMEKLSERERKELGQRYLTDFVKLSFEIKTEDEVRVFSAAVLACVAALQQEMGVTPDLSPAWIMAAAQHFSPRLDTLLHILQIQPHLPPLILKQKDRPDMHEDIQALGICVEETKLQLITSLSQCSVFLGRVELLQPCLQRVFSPTYCSLCSPGCLKHLDAIKSVWQGMLVVAAFIEQVVMKVNSRDEKLVALSLKHCSQLQRLMEESSELQSKACLQQLIRILNAYHKESISRELRFGLMCPVCLEYLAKPCVLQCEHVFCLSCMERCMQGEEAKCPKCRTQLPPDYQPAISVSIDSALKQHRELRRCCNSFFLEVISRFCFSKGKRPQEDLVELLFSLLISAQGDVYKTRELTPFLECVDQSPVVRSVLPKLLLQYSFDQVKGHIQTYLKNLEDKLLDDEDRMELYRLFVNCFQDSLFCADLSETLEAKELQEHQQEDIKFLSRLARKQTPSRERQPAEFLLSMARFRMCLDTAAHILPRAVSHQSGECVEWEQRMLEQVKAVCEYSKNDWYRVYLLRTLNRQAGTDCVQAVMNSTSYEWVFPAELLRLQRLIPVEVDRFLCCGEQYRTVRNGVGQALMESNTDALKAALQNVSSSESVKSVLLALALFRQVTCRIESPDPVMRPGAEELELLKDSVRKSIAGSGYLRELCNSLLSNPSEGFMSHLHVCASESAQRRLLLELLVHAIAVFHSGSQILHPFHVVASKPQAMRDSFLPTMPDDNTSMVIQGLKEGNLKLYYCKNGHLSVVGECGKPMIVAKCDTCKVPIGGRNHNAVAGFTLVQGSLPDQTRPGHILDDAARRSEAPNRDLSMAQSCLLRLFLHLAMLHGSSLNHQGIRAMIHPEVNNVREFLWRHLEKDMEVLGKTLNLNWDDIAIMVHLILNTSAQLPTVRSQQGATEWSSRHAREQWEKRVCETVINPILKDLNRHLSDAQEQVAADDKLSSSALMKMLKGDPRSLFPLPSECPTHHASFWTPPDTLTVEHLCQLIAQKQAEKRVPLLSLFLIKVQYIRHLACLPDLAALLSDLIRIVPTDTETHSLPIATLLHNIPAGLHRNTLKKRLQIFFRVWNHLRMELANNTALGLAPELCAKDITMDSSSQFLCLSSHGPGSCLRALIEQLSETHNSLVREAQKLSHQEDSDYSVPIGAVSESQLALCHPEKELLPLVLAHCHYTLLKGQQTASDYDLQAIEKQFYRRFLAGKPRILTDTEKYLKRHHQDFSVVLRDVRSKIPQEPLKGSVCASIRTVLRSFTEVCDAVYALEIGLRFLGKTGGDPKFQLLSYLQDSLKMKQYISSNVAKALADVKLDQCTATWQLLTCWKSELKLRRGQDPIPRLSKEYREMLSADLQKELNEFLNVTDVELFTLELHEILLLKTDINSENRYGSQWDIKYTLELHLEEKGAPALPGLDNLSEEICLSKSAEVWRLAVNFKR
ncbi:E3 ubiquitin-protein ligase rnf213-beta isoform X1 [Hemibagrus wyckioides]|uniref:E3 ubiquitin-protein ligase rnf213-beta isoform X1 n=1 Tax=Hemibagrus wyckioides TaxID=337641 RepID=UPI00266DD64D|nr:E3 ubiquitin-protein ligase rnf213-beta isoform X1 [Hemibagrus wyckioides]XP_058262203.1 E3 ubiquitin-protein ligase rnf213-beta isoform X1 [Hemibagrus wyckioides]